MKILIVEDQENLAKLIKNGLENEGFTADYILDGESAQRRIEMRDHDYDLVILDVMLPKKTGTEICKVEVLLARVKALLRRPKTVLPPMLTAKDILLNPVTKQVFRKKQEIQLTLKEFALLEYFIRHPNQVLNREQILANLWDFAFDSFSNVVDVHITNLRKKIGDTGGTLLKTVYGVGYKLEA
ncbi:MAG: response regulator transcription factor [Candidatus Magasanikbacteria bacterium]|nr:response regulator transcription factor [Candidatus Magasanikbacteria bacterium]